MAARVQAKGAGGSSAAPSVTLDAAPAQGNVLVAFVFSTSTTAITGSGWTLGTSQGTGTGGSTRAGRMLWKIAGAGESATQTLAAGNASWAMVLAEYSGIDTTTPLNVQNSTAPASSSTLTTPTVTTTANSNGGVVVAAGGVRTVATYSAETVNSSATGVSEAAEAAPASAASSAVWDLFVSNLTATTYSGAATASAAAVQVTAIAVFNAAAGGATVSGSATLSGASTLSTSPAVSHSASAVLAGASTLEIAYTVPGSIDATDTTDVTSDINSWLAGLPDGAIARFNSGATYRIEGTLTVPNRTDLTIDGRGATFHCHAAPTESQPMWKVADSTRVTLKNMTLTASYASPGTFTSAVEHAHAVSIIGSSYVGVESVTMNNFAGDGIYYGLSESGSNVRSSNCHDTSVTINGTGRNGISYVACTQITSTGTTVNTIGLYGFDVEPNYGVAASTVDHVSIVNPTIHTCRSYSVAIVENNTIDSISLSGGVCDDPNGYKITVDAVLGNPVTRPTNLSITNETCNTQYSNPLAWSIKHVDGLTLTGNAIALWCSAPAGHSYVALAEDCTSVTASGNTLPFTDGPNLPAAGFLTSIPYGAGSLDGSSTLGVALASSVTGSAVLSGAATLGATGSGSIPAAVPLSGSGSLAASGRVQSSSAAALSGVGTLVAAPAVQRAASAALAGAATLTAAGSKQTPVTVALAGAATLASGGADTTSSAATLAGAGTLAAPGFDTTQTAAALAGSGTLAAAGVGQHPTAAALAAAGALFASSGGQSIASAALAGTAALTATGTGQTSAATQMTGSSSLTAVGRQNTTISSALAGSGVLAAAGQVRVTATATIAGLGALTATASGPTAAAALAGAAGLSVAPTVARPAAAQISGTSALSTTGSPNHAAATVFASAGTLSALAQQQALSGLVALAGVSTLGADGTVIDVSGFRDLEITAVTVTVGASWPATLTLEPVTAALSIEPVLEAQ